jgi:hypothetical protein
MALMRRSPGSVTKTSSRFPRSLFQFISWEEDLNHEARIGARAGQDQVLHQDVRLINGRRPNPAAAAPSFTVLYKFFAIFSLENGTHDDVQLLLDLASKS